MHIDVTMCSNPACFRRLGQLLVHGLLEYSFMMVGGLLIQGECSLPTLQLDQ